MYVVIVSMPVIATLQPIIFRRIVTFPEASLLRLATRTRRECEDLPLLSFDMLLGTRVLDLVLQTATVPERGYDPHLEALP